MDDDFQPLKTARKELSGSPDSKHRPRGAAESSKYNNLYLSRNSLTGTSSISREIYLKTAHVCVL